jgi:hypothetical protein
MPEIGAQVIGASYRIKSSAAMIRRAAVFCRSMPSGL